MTEALVPLLVLLAKSTVVVLVAWMLAAALRALRAPAATRHRVWLAAFVLVALLPVLGPALPHWVVAVPYERLGFDVVDLSTPGEHHPDRAAARWILVVWAVGAAVMLLHFAMAHVALRRLWRQAETYTSPQIDALQRLAGTAGAVEVRVAGAPIAPLTWGRRILLPPQAMDWSASRMRDVLLHEICHMARRDSATQSLASIVRAAFWFSPAVWFALRALRNAQEYACDERVIGLGPNRVEYAQTLLDVAAATCPGPGFPGASAMAQRSILEQRVRNILRAQAPRPLRIVASTVLATVMLVTGALVAAAHPVDLGRRLSPLAPLAPQSDGESVGQRLSPLAPRSTTGMPRLSPLAPDLDLVASDRSHPTR